MPTDPDPGDGMSIADMIKAVNSLIAYFSGSDGGLKQEDIEETLSPVAKTLSKIRAELRQLFIYQEKATPLIPGENNKDVEDKENATKKMEYAVCIRITSGVEISEEMSKLFDFKALTFAIWKTDRKKVLSRMNVGSIKDLLEAPAQIEEGGE